ncbi:MAG: IMP cyclohydrolase [Firmicutes bacterium]|nr:IMP cyclohydrolase [Bacillota bacterium]
MAELLDLKQVLCDNEYPGRGIIMGKSADDRHAVFAYFIMGRSENSRNRVFVEEGSGIRTEAFDPSKMIDPSLVIYAPVRVLEDKTIVTNGDQTDTIYDYLKAGKSMRQALRTRTFEPDAPNFTPRISAVAKIKKGRFSYRMSILKSSFGREESCERFYYDYDQPIAGEGRFIHTYRCNGSPIPSFSGEPEAVSVNGTIDEFTSLVWNALNEENKVSLFVRFVNLQTGKTETRIVNKNVK